MPDLGLLTGFITAGFGLLSCFFGFRMFRLILALIGFGVGFSLGTSFFGADQQTFALIVGILLGAIGAIILYALYFVGVTVAGAILGAFLAVSILTLLNAEGGAIVVIAVIIGMVIGAVIALAINKIMIIISTAASGAGSVIYGVSIIFPGLLMTMDVGGNANVSIMGVVVWLVLAIAGIAFQYNENRDEL